MSRKVYAVANGRQTGFFNSWAECEAQVSGYSGAKFKSFSSAAAAQEYMNEAGGADPPSARWNRAPSSSHPIRTRTRYSASSSVPYRPRSDATTVPMSSAPSRPRSDHIYDPDLVVYADGSCLSNGQAGSRAGVGAWYGHDDKRNISTHLRGARQTNQRAELTAALMVLKGVDPEKNRSVEIRTDSAYTIGSTTDWMVKYHEKGNPGNKTYQNLDLMSAVYLHARQLKQQGVTVKWTHVKGHSGDAGNDAADALARSGAMRCQNE